MAAGMQRPRLEDRPVAEESVGAMRWQIAQIKSKRLSPLVAGLQLRNGLELKAMPACANR